MANLCEYDMYIVGNRAALAEIAKAAAGYRIYDMYVFDQGHNDGRAVLELYGNCKWSFEDAFRFTEHDGFAETISAKGATAEVWSTEPSEFREHFFVTPEGIAVNEEFKYREALYYEADMPFDQWRAENGIPEGVIRDDLEDGELYVECEAEIDWSPIVTPYGDGWIPSGDEIAYFGGARSFESQLQAIDAWAGTAEATKLDQPFDIYAAKRARTSSPMAQDSERGIHR
jgi:hypothetical protein